MGIVSNAMLIVSGVYLALGLIYLRFWWAERGRLVYLAFTIACLSSALFSWFELGMMRAAIPEEYLFYAWWSFFPGSIALISRAWFGYIHLHGRKWLFAAYSSSRILAVILHLIMTNGINFRRINAVGNATILGETLSYPIAVPNPWMVIPHLSHILLIIFFLDASVRCWRRGKRRQALTFGTGTILFGGTILIFSVGVLWGLAPVPLASSFASLFFIAAMLYELNYDMHRSAMLSEKLEERDAQLTETLEHLQLSAAAANVGMWTRKIGDEKLWVSAKAGEILGFPSGEQFTREEFFQSVHPEDRWVILSNIQELEEGKSEFWLEYRLITANGEIRWVESRGKVEMVNGARFIRGAIVDVTQRKLAEEAVHELSGKLMNAQEKERARLARELHDDLSQRLALLSIQLSQFRDEPGQSDNMKQQIGRLGSEVSQVSASVRRISHELHPAKLRQLGLESALRGLCRELTDAHPIEVDFEAEDLPVKLPDDVSLCLYRVTQESLQNVVKHSGASAAQASIKLEQDEIYLSISDNGSGFDINAEKTKESLGLISIDERVRAVKGTVKITSRVGAGTRIEVHVPVGNNSENEINNNSKIEIKNKSIRVFVADDSKAMLDAVVGLLTPHFEVVGTAADGKTALEIIDHLKPDIAVLDISMPFKTGIEIAANLKTSAPEVKVVIISAHDDESYISSASRAGALAYVVKASLGDELIPALESAYAGNGFVSPGDKVTGIGKESSR